MVDEKEREGRSSKASALPCLIHQDAGATPGAATPALEDQAPARIKAWPMTAAAFLKLFKSMSRGNVLYRSIGLPADTQVYAFITYKDTPGKMVIILESNEWDIIPFDQDVPEITVKLLSAIMPPGALDLMTPEENAARIVAKSRIVPASSVPTKLKLIGNPEA